jgi:hypothetical protein
MDTNGQFAPLRRSVRARGDNNRGYPQQGVGAGQILNTMPCKVSAIPKITQTKINSNYVFSSPYPRLMRNNRQMKESSVLWATAILSVVAIIVSPLVALWVQRRVEARKALQERREAIFKALWVNRRRQFYLARVDALNMIDVEFFGERKCVMRGITSGQIISRMNIRV